MNPPRKPTPLRRKPPGPDLHALSEHAAEELRALVEAAADIVPTSMLGELATLELIEASVVVHLDDDLQRIHIPEHIAVAALDFTQAVPCRLTLLLRSLDPQQRTDLALRLTERDALPPGADPIEQIADILAFPTRLAHVLLRLPASAIELLWAIVDSGGFLPLDPGAEELQPAESDLHALADRGLLFTTLHDRRVPAEVLRALLEGRLLRQIQALLTTWRRVVRAGRQDNLVMFPFHAGRVLGELAELLLQRPSWPLEELSVALGLHTQSVPVAALVDLAEVLSVARRRGQTCTAGVALRVHRRCQQWRDASEAERLQRLLDTLLQGAPASPLEASVADLLGVPDPSEHPEQDEQDTSGWGALPPHAVAAMEPEDRLAGYAHGRDLARVLLYGAFSSLDPGRLYPLDALAGVAQHVADAARTFARLSGLLYGATPAPPQPDAAARTVRAWVQAVALPLGWAVIEDERHTPEPTQRPERRDDATLPLFDLEARTAAPPQPPPTPVADGRAWVRIVQPWPHPDPAILRAFIEDLGHYGDSLLDLLALPWGQRDAASSPQEPTRPWRRAEPDAPAWIEPLERVLAEGLDPRLAPPLRHLEAFLRRTACTADWAAIGGDTLAAFLAELLQGRRADRDRSALRRTFLALDVLHAALRSQGLRPGFRALEVRQRLEGPLLRAESVEHAIRSFQGRVPPADLLAAPPERLIKGAVRVLTIDRDAATVTVEPLDPEAAARLGHLAVRLDPKPLCFLRVGDTFDATLVRYGVACWLSQLRWLLPEPLDALRAAVAPPENKPEQRRPSLD